MSNQQIQKVRVKRLAHVGLWTADVLSQARFYHQVLGFDLCGAIDQDLELDDANAFLSAGNARYCLGLFSDTRPQPANGRRATPRTPLHHLAFEVDTDAELAALAARLKIAGVELTLSPRDGDPDLGDTLWFNDPDGNRIEVLVAPDDLLAPFSAPAAPTRRQHSPSALPKPSAIQHIALRTAHLETIVEFYTESLGFDISDWLLRECAWLRCNNNHHTIVFMQGDSGIDHVGYSVSDGGALLSWADRLSQHDVPVLWGPGRHGAGNDLFLRLADADGIHIELSTGMMQYFDHDVTTPPRLWHTRAMAFNLWGPLPSWLQEEVHV
ncbi:MAG: VOC family protein [Ktedonobacteraceae bacterium]|nr:VOC family protein [Ktedonobacteraceae bacterium]